MLKEQALAEDAVQDSFLYLAINIHDDGDVQSPNANVYIAGILDSYELLKQFGITNE